MKIIESVDNLKDIFESEKTGFKCIFKHIIFFTNDRDVKKNKTLNNLVDALKKQETKLHVFVAEETKYDDNGNTVHIWDTKEDFTLKDESNVDTLVIARLGAQGEPMCEELINILQDWGFLVLNPIGYAKRASNKYQTAVLLEKTKLPQPNFSLLQKEDINNEKKFKECLKRIYDDYGKNENKDEEKEYVIKILDGHGGTGVFLSDGKHLMAILQAIFAINPEQQLLLQRKEEADGGDIRVHVLTLRNKQIILASMKRVKLSKDFRSNVSLGASAEPVKLTEEQKQIALDAAKVSNLPWCGVDIMPLKKGSNKEIGDNVILEFNASPGTDGISEVIKENFMELLLKELNNPNEFFIQNKTAGFRERIDITLKDNKEPIEFLAKLDTGNGSDCSTLGCDKVEISEDEKTMTATIKGKKYEFEITSISNVSVGTNKYKRYNTIFPNIKIGNRHLTNVEFSIVDNRKKSTDVLLNRDVLKRMAYTVSANETHILTPEKDIISR